ncbi:unnamed protein product [Amoebophrya sp. A120]|nr:unnamed protein product [Amoebophrya sp. A120]|eukprot:GSA120T00006530001.1
MDGTAGSSNGHASLKRERSEAEDVDVIFVTGNQSKVNEVNRYFEELEQNDGPAAGDKKKNKKINIRAVKLDLPELQGEPEDISAEKCLQAYREYWSSLEKTAPGENKAKDFVIFTEDTSLCFNALNGLPGPYVKWFLEKTGCEGLNNLLAAYEDKTGFAQTIFACCGTLSCFQENKAGNDGPQVRTFVGQTHGQIVPARGDPNFGGKGKGWDPVFLPDDSAERHTYAEMSPSAKNKISHRSRSLAKLHKFLLEIL